MRGDLGVADARGRSRRSRTAGRSRARHAAPARRVRGAAARRRASAAGAVARFARARIVASAMPSSIDWLAPCPRCGSIGCAASPSRLSLPLVQVGSGSRSYSAQRNVSCTSCSSCSMRAVPACELAPKHVRVAGSRPRFLHLLVRRHEPDIVDELSGAHRKGEEVFSLAEPHLPAVGRPMRNPLVRHQAPIGDGSREHRLRWWAHVRPKLGVDAVRRDDEIGFGASLHWRTTPAPRRRPARSRCTDARCARRRPAGHWPASRRGRRGAFRMSRSSPRSPSPGPARWALRRGGSSAKS